MKLFAVLDTNVLVSALLLPESLPGRIAKEALEGRIIPLYNDEILREYRDVLAREKFRFDPENVSITLGGIIDRGIAVDAADPDEIFPDPTDRVFYAVTMEGRKSESAYLVTGNLKHFPQAPFVVTPREMMDILDKTD